MILIISRIQGKHLWLTKKSFCSPSPKKGALVLLVSMVLIIQSENVVDLLKDCLALFIISEIDDVFYALAKKGFLGKQLSNDVENAKTIAVDDDPLELNCMGTNMNFRLKPIMLLTLMAIMIGGWVAGSKYNRIRSAISSPSNSHSTCSLNGPKSISCGQEAFQLSRLGLRRVRENPVSCSVI